MSHKNDVVVTLKVKVGGKKLRTTKVTNNVPDIQSGLALVDAVQEAVSEMAAEVRQELSL
jgi:hypothetical protein